MDDNEHEVQIPIIREELHAEAVPVVTGGVRVTKHVETHDELVEQQLRKSHVDVKRVKVDRVVDGPQPTRRAGNTLIIPVVSEIIRVEKQWVVTEEIHIIETEERETVQQRVPVSREEARIERLNRDGEVAAEEAPAQNVTRKNYAADSARQTSGASSILSRANERRNATRKPLSQPRTILNKKPDVK